MKPRFFIGSSTEALSIAYAIQENLEHDALCTVWTQGIFSLSQTTLDNLIKATGNFDFAIFVFQPDDILQLRDEKVTVARDNVVFELGLFIGELGKERVFFLVPTKSEELHLPTDLIGIQPGHYVPPANNRGPSGSAWAIFCNNIRRQIQSFWTSKVEASDELEQVHVVLAPKPS